MNQCDGCRRSLPTEDGIHMEPVVRPDGMTFRVTGWRPYMCCTKNRYPINVRGTVTGRMSSTEPFVDHCGDLERGVPNLDAMDMSHLYKFIAATRGIRPYRAARRMFGEVPAYATVVALHNYARNKVTAMACRERGDIATALMYEGICETIYDSLPEYARW
ncbi:MAG: hypothetical protein ACYSW8_29550 [Planctomycetota bacterium]